jgi:hypothetical protein
MSYASRHLCSRRHWPLATPACLISARDLVPRRKDEGRQSFLGHPGLAQTFDHVGVVFRTKPRTAPANVTVGRGWRDCDSLLQCFPCFLDLTSLAESGSQPTIGQRKIRI